MRWPYPYVSHLLDLPPEVAELHFDLACLHLAADGRLSDTTGRPVLAVRSGRLEFDRAHRPVESRRAYHPWRAVRGTLHPLGWWASGIAVDLELLPWSATRSELALVAGPVRHPGRIGERRYLRLAHDVLHLLTDTLRCAGADTCGPDPLDRQPSGAEGTASTASWAFDWHR
jgi:hypothetical protein